MDKSTNTHQKVAATFISVYYHAISEGNIDLIANMYMPSAKVNHWNVEGAGSALKCYSNGARVVVTDMEPKLVDNTRLKITVKGNITIEGEQKKDFQHDVEVLHIGTSASQLSFGVSSDFLRTVAALPPPPKMKFDDWSADTPPLTGQQGSDAVPDIEFQKVAKTPTPQVTPKMAPAPAQPVPTAVAEEKAEPVVEKKAEEPITATKKEESQPQTTESSTVAAPAPTAPKGWANIVRSDKPQGAKTVISVVDPTKKVAPVAEEKKVEKVEKDEPSPKERERERRAAPIFYDIFVKGFPDTIKESEVPEALGLNVAVSNTKIDTKNDKSGVPRAFVYIKLSQEDLSKKGISRDAAIEKIIADNKNTKFANKRLNVETIKERFEDSSAKGKK